MDYRQIRKIVNFIYFFKISENWMKKFVKKLDLQKKMIFHQDNAYANFITIAKINDYELLHPPDLVPSDFWLFSRLKNLCV